MSFNEKSPKEVPVVKVKDEKEEVLKEAINKVNKIEDSKEVTVKVLRLNVREHANSNSKVVKTLKNGDKIKVSSTPVGEFYKVTDPVEGYVMREFVG